MHSFRASDIKNAKKLPDGTQNRRSKPEISSVRHVLGHFDVGRFAGQTYYLLNLGIGLWRGAAVDQIYYRSVWDAGVGLETYFAGAAVGVSLRCARLFDGRAQLTKCIGVEFGVGKSFVASKSATPYALG